MQVNSLRDELKEFKASVFNLPESDVEILLSSFYSQKANDILCFLYNKSPKAAITFKVSLFQNTLNSHHITLPEKEEFKSCILFFGALEELKKNSFYIEKFDVNTFLKEKFCKNNLGEIDDKAAKSLLHLAFSKHQTHYFLLRTDEKIKKICYLIQTDSHPKYVEKEYNLEDKNLLSLLKIENTIIPLPHLIKEGDAAYLWQSQNCPSHLLKIDLNHPYLIQSSQLHRTASGLNVFSISEELALSVLDSKVMDTWMICLSEDQRPVLMIKREQNVIERVFLAHLQDDTAQMIYSKYGKENQFIINK